MKTSATARRWMENLKALRNDERGAEGAELILVLVVLVVGLFGMWTALRDRLENKGEQTGECIDTADTANAC